MDKHSNEIKIAFDESNTKLITKSILFWLFSIVFLSILTAIGVLISIKLINDFYHLRTKTIVAMSLYSIIFIPSVLMLFYSIINVKAIVLRDVDTKRKLKMLENNRISAYLIKSELVNIRHNKYSTSYDYKYTFKTEKGDRTYKSSNRSTNEKLLNYLFNVEQQKVDNIPLELIVDEDHSYVWNNELNQFLSKIDTANQRVHQQQITKRHQSDKKIRQLIPIDNEMSTLQISLVVGLVISVIELFNSALKNGFTSLSTKFAVVIIVVCLIGLFFQLTKSVLYNRLKKASQVSKFKITSCEFGDRKLTFNPLMQNSVKSVDRFNLILENNQMTLQLKFSGATAFQSIRKLIVDKQLSKKLVVDVYAYKSNYYVDMSYVRQLIKELETQLEKQ